MNKSICTALCRAARLLAFLSLAGCSQAGSETRAEAPVAPRPVVAEVLDPVELSSGFQTTGIVQADVQVDLSFRVGGFVDQIHVEEGDRVQSGEPLITLDLRDLHRQFDLDSARLQRAEAVLKDAQAEFDRQARLLASKQTSEREYLNADAQLGIASAERQQARVSLAMVRDQLSDAVLRAPMDGHVQSRQIEVHEYAQPRVPVMGLVSMARVKVRATVPDRNAGLLALDGESQVWGNSDPDRVLNGRITLIGAAADRETRAIPFEVTVENADFRLRPDTVATVRVVRAGRPGVLVPVSAVLRDIGRRPFCFVVDESDGNPRARRRSISLDGLEGERVGVREGLTAGERIVVAGQHFLTDGDPLELLPVGADE